MNLLNRFRKDPMPEWANCFSYKEFGTFREAVQSYFDDHQSNAEYDFTQGLVKPHAGMFEGATLGLANLAKRCAGVPAPEMQHTVHSWFGNFWRIQEERDEITRMSFEHAQKFIKARLFYNGAGEYQFAAGSDIDEILRLVLVYDLEHSTASLLESDVDRYPVSLKELTEQAVDRTLRVERECSQVREIASGPLKGAHMVVEPSDSFLSIFALDPQLLFNSQPKNGFLVGIPSRSFFIAYPLESAASTSMIKELSRLIGKVSEQDEGLISSNPYWFTGGHLKRLEFEREKPDGPNWREFVDTVGLG
jgi:hypothetical protein